MEYSLIALGLFALIHWLCDLGWLEVLSFIGFKGSSLGNRGQKVISLICSIMLLGFGVKFDLDAGIGLLGLYPNYSW